LDKFPEVVSRLKGVLERFADALSCIDQCFIADDMLEQLPAASQVGKTTVGGIDLNKTRMRAVVEAVIALSPSPNGFSAADIATRVGERCARYGPATQPTISKSFAANTSFAGSLTRAATNPSSTVSGRSPPSSFFATRPSNLSSPPPYHFVPLAVPTLAEVHARARELASRLSRPRALLSALWGQYWDHCAWADLNRARRLAVELRELGNTSGDVPMQVMGCEADGHVCMLLGEFAAGQAYLEKGLALYDPADRPSYSELLPHDALVWLRAVSSWVLACLGHLDQALFQRDAALDEARRLSHPPTLAVALASTWLTGWLVRLEPGSLLQHADETLALTTEHGLRQFQTMALALRGWCLAALRREDEGIRLLTAGLAGRHELGLIVHRPILLALLGDSCRMAGQCQAALENFAEARALAEETEQRPFQAEIFRLTADALLTIGDRASAGASYREAIAIAQQQSAKLWELRAAISLARLWRDQGKLTEARNLLGPVYGWFTQGFDTPILQEAKALLEELAS
jgi:predicted ATPase